MEEMEELRMVSWSQGKVVGIWCSLKQIGRANKSKSHAFHYEICSTGTLSLQVRRPVGWYERAMYEAWVIRGAFGGSHLVTVSELGACARWSKPDLTDAGQHGVLKENTEEKSSHLMMVGLPFSTPGISGGPLLTPAFRSLLFLPHAKSLLPSGVHSC